MNESLSKTLAALCDTVLPSQPSESEGSANGVGRGALERGLIPVVEGNLASLEQRERDRVEQLLQALSADGFEAKSLAERTAQVRDRVESSVEDRRALRQVRLALFAGLFGGHPEDVLGAIGYPGPVTAPPSPSTAPAKLPATEPDASGVLDCDAVIIGSGAGGSVIADRLSAAGKSVIVVEAGEYLAESDFDQTEATGARMYLRGGLFWDRTGNLGVLAGSALGGGTVINSMVCLRPPADILSLWAEHGLDGLDGPEFLSFVDMVWERLNVNTEATTHNNSTQLMIKGLGELGKKHEVIPRNSTLDDDASLCGYCNQGCQQGSKRSTLKNYLQSAVESGTQLLIGCWVDRIRSEDGRAQGVDVTTRNGSRITINAPVVVVAAGGVESPAVLLRSGIGGPAAGEHLRVHPAWMVGGRYDTPVQAWNGQIQSAVSFDYAHLDGGGGFLCESVGLGPAFWAANRAFTSGAAQWEHLLGLGHVAAWHAVSHDHGSGRVLIDDDGQAVVEWQLDDSVDQSVARTAHEELARIHHAAGAKEIFNFLGLDVSWRDGEDFDEYLEAIRNVPVEAYTAFSAHQMGSCRMGSEPESSVADGDGQLHDTKGVWIGDASALPTAPGVNPMITLMALAERTATKILAAEN